MTAPPSTDRGLFDVLLGLDIVGLGDPSAVIEAATPLPGWAWVTIVIFACALAWAGYRGLIGPRPARVALTGVRVLLIVLIALLLTRPALVVRETSIEPDTVLILADRSLSMTLGDDTGTRDDTLRGIVRSGAEAWSNTGDERIVRWLGFSGGVFELDAPTSEAWNIAPPDGPVTALGTTLSDVLRRAAGAPVAGVVVLSDGRSGDEVSAQTLRRLTAARVPVYAVALGEADGPGDVRLASVEAPGAGWSGDPAAVSVRLEGSDADALRGTLRLLDTLTGQTLDEAEVSPDDTDDDAPEAERPTAERTLLARVPEGDPRRWSVEFVPDGPDAVPANNSREVLVTPVADPLRVLYIDGYPRWEQRYVKSLLLREPSIVSANLLLGPGRRYLQEGDEEVAQLPETPEEWSDWDAVVLGDVRPELFGESQLAALRTHVAERGGGLLWIAGPSSTPAAWNATPLADLLPMDPGESGPTIWDVPVTLDPAGESRRLGVLRLDDDGRRWPDSLRAHETGWSRLRWVQRLEPASLKPAVEILADAVTDTGDRAPALLHMRFGNGRVLYVGTDETWRWRYGRGEDLQERFWLPLVRLLARDAAAGSAPVPVALRTDPGDPVVQRRVTITLDVRDQALLEGLGDRVAASITDPEGRDREITLRSDAGSGLRRRYTGAWVPPDAGAYTLRITEPLLAGLELSSEIRVQRPDDELLRPRPDHALLERIAEATGGAVIEANEFARLPERLGDRRIVSEGVRAREPLWDSPLALLLVVLLLSIEWVGRRLIRLV